MTFAAAGIFGPLDPPQGGRLVTPRPLAATLFFQGRTGKLVVELV